MLEFVNYICAYTFLFAEGVVDWTHFACKCVLNLMKYGIYYFPNYSGRGISKRDHAGMYCETRYSLMFRNLASTQLYAKGSLKYSFQQAVIYMFTSTVKSKGSPQMLYVEGVGPSFVYQPFKGTLFKEVICYEPNLYLRAVQSIIGNKTIQAPIRSREQAKDCLFISDDFLHHYDKDFILSYAKDVMSYFEHVVLIVNSFWITNLRGLQEAQEVVDALTKIVGRCIPMAEEAKVGHNKPWSSRGNAYLLAFVTF